MIRDKGILVEITILVLISLWFFFIATNVSPVLGNIYNNLAILSIVIIVADVLFGKKTI